ncbi:MAG: hypothetical protein ACRCWY_10925 [Cellulosilyticaceae bacterium]
MERIGTIIAVIGAIGFIVAMWILFGYLYFKKGSLKKGFLLLLVSLLMVAGGVYVGIQGAWVNAEKGIALSDDVIHILENIEVEDATQEQSALVGGSVYLKINEDAWTKYEEEIIAHYIAWQRSLASEADDETLKAEFRALREKTLSK